MARRRQNLLKEIVEVRQLQQKAAQMRSATAASALNQLGEERAQTLQMRSDDEARWDDALNSRGMDLNLASSWSRAVVGQDSALRWLDRRIAEAEKNKASANKAWHQASARVQGAESLERKSRKQDNHRRDEAALHRLSDQLAGRGHHEG